MKKITDKREAKQLSLFKKISKHLKTGDLKKRVDNIIERMKNERNGSK